MSAVVAPSSPALSRTVTLAEGRTVGYAEVGTQAGRAVVYCHATPASRLDALLFAQAAAAHDVRLIAPDRPGIGLSDVRAPWRVGNWAADAAALADALGLERFAVLGWSGGGPYALACAWALRDRVSATAVVAGSAPAEAGTAGMAPADRVLEGLARRSPAAARALLAPMAAVGRRRPALARRAVELGLPAVDRTALAQAPAGVRDLAAFREAFRRGTRGVALDYRALGSPWGFRPEDVAARVTVWQGEADRTVPPAHADYLAARLPRARLRRVPGGGHLLALTHANEILGDL